MSNPLDDAVKRFQPKHKQVYLLHENKEAVLRLRAKGATCAEIETLLKQNGVLVSEASIVRFCRQHKQEIVRPISYESEEVTPQPPAQTPTITKSSSKMRDLRGPV